VLGLHSGEGKDNMVISQLFFARGSGVPTWLDFTRVRACMQTVCMHKTARHNVLGGDCAFVYSAQQQAHISQDRICVLVTALSSSFRLLHSCIYTQGSPDRFKATLKSVCNKQWVVTSAPSSIAPFRQERSGTRKQLL